MLHLAFVTYQSQHSVGKSRHHGGAHTGHRTPSYPQLLREGSIAATSGIPGTPVERKFVPLLCVKMPRTLLFSKLI